MKGERKMRKTKKSMVITATTLFLIAIIITQTLVVSRVFATVPDEPHAGDAMWIEPSTIDLSTDVVSVGYRFNVTVWVNLTVSSLSWEFKLRYNKNHLNATRCAYTNGSKSEFFKDINTLALTVSYGTINATHDFVLHGEVAFMSERDPGYGSLAWVEFEVMTVPSESESYTSILDIASDYPGETYAQNPGQEKIPLNIFNGNYRISGPEAPPPQDTGWLDLGYTINSGAPSNPTDFEVAFPNGTIKSYNFIEDTIYVPVGTYQINCTYDSETQTETAIVEKDEGTTVIFNFIRVQPPSGDTVLYVDPPEITKDSHPTLEPSSNFTVYITIANVSDMQICEFNLTYNPDVMGFIGINIYKVQNQIPTVQIVLDDEAGFLWVKLMYQTGITTISSPLVAIVFHMESYGESI